jgi:hypothetical protein
LKPPLVTNGELATRPTWQTPPEQAQAEEMLIFERLVIEQELIVSPSASVAEGRVNSALTAVIGVLGAQERVDKTGGLSTTLTTTVVVLVTATEASVAPRVTDPAFAPVKLAV